MKTKLLPLAFASILTLPTVSKAELHHHQHHTGPTAPIGVMGSHMHPEGEWMLSYTLMQMKMDGNRDGTESVSTPLAGYMVSPQSMDMDMHMLGVMMGYSENITLMAMLPVLSLSMDHTVNMTAAPFTTEASGIGDLNISAIIKTNERWLTKLGINLPSGSIDEKDVTPMSAGNPVQLPYPMQTGSGSYEFYGGLTYSDGEHNTNWGTQLNVTLRLNDNDRDYRLGNRLEITSWYSYAVDEQQSVSIRIKLQDWGNIKGADAELNPMMVPTADANLRAGSRADVLLGYNYQISKNILMGIEAGAPVYEKLDGPQLETDLILQLGAQYAF